MLTTVSRLVVLPPSAVTEKSKYFCSPSPALLETSAGEFLLWKFLILRQWSCRCLLPTQASLGHTQSSSRLEVTQLILLVPPLGAVELPEGLCEEVAGVPARGPYPGWNFPSDKRAVGHCCAQPCGWDVLWLGSFSHVQLCTMAGVRLRWLSPCDGAACH